MPGISPILRRSRCGTGKKILSRRAFQGTGKGRGRDKPFFLLFGLRFEVGQPLTQAVTRQGGFVFEAGREEWGSTKGYVPMWPNLDELHIAAILHVLLSTASKSYTCH